MKVGAYLLEAMVLWSFTSWGLLAWVLLIFFCSPRDFTLSGEYGEITDKRGFCLCVSFGKIVCYDTRSFAPSWRLNVGLWFKSPLFPPISLISASLRDSISSTFSTLLSVDTSSRRKYLNFIDMQFFCTIVEKKVQGADSNCLRASV